MAEVEDVEIAMHAFRLMRTGRYLKADELLAAVKEDFPEVEEARIRAVLRQLAERLVRNG